MKLLVTLFIIKIFARINIEVLRCFFGLGVGKCVRLLADKFGQQVKSGSVPKYEKFVRYAFFNMQAYFLYILHLGFGKCTKLLYITLLLSSILQIFLFILTTIHRLSGVQDACYLKWDIPVPICVPFCFHSVNDYEKT